MKSVKYNKQDHEKELAEKQKKLQEQAQRDDYLKRLRETKKFQKYVVEEILQKNLSELTDTRVIQKTIQKGGGDVGNRKELGDVVIQSILARNQLEKIISELLN